MSDGPAQLPGAASGALVAPGGQSGDLPVVREPEQLTELLVAAGSSSRMSRAERARALGKAVPALAVSAQRAGLRAVAAGRWITDVAMEIAPRIPVRDRETLHRQYPGQTDAQIAAELIRVASLVTAALGAAAGALAAVEFAAPPTLLMAPAQLGAHLLAVLLVETKLVAELHELADRRPNGGPAERAGAYLVSWSQRKALDAIFKPSHASGPMTEGSTGLTAVLSATAVIQIRRLLMRRLAHSTTTLAPLLLGAVAGAEIDRRATRAIGRMIARDLGLRL